MSMYERYADHGIEVDEGTHAEDHPGIVSDLLNSSPSLHTDFYNNFGDLCDLELLPPTTNSVDPS